MQRTIPPTHLLDRGGLFDRLDSLLGCDLRASKCAVHHTNQTLQAIPSHTLTTFLGVTFVAAALGAAWRWHCILVDDGYQAPSPPPHTLALGVTFLADAGLAAGVANL